MATRRISRSTARFIGLELVPGTRRLALDELPAARY